MESALVVFTVCLTLAFLFAELFHRLRYPRVVGQLLAGVLLGLPFIRVFFPDDALSLIGFLADIGVVFLLLLVGTEVRVHDLKRVSGRALFLAVAGYLIPLAAGFVFMSFIGFDPLASLLTGICLAISAEAITVDILMEYDLLKTTLGATIMEAGMIDDLLGVMSLTAVIAVVHGGFKSLLSIPGEFVAFILISYVIGFTLLPRAARVVWREKSEAAVFSLAVIFGLIIVLLSVSFGLSSVVGAFVAGIIIQLSVKNRIEEKEMVESLNVVTFGLVIPFFFIHVGMNLDLAHVTGSLPLVAALALIAFAGKMGAAHLTGVRYRLHRRDRSLIGWGMNPRGAVELVIANIAYANGLFTMEVFSAVVAMTLVAAFVSPMMFRRALSRR